MPSSSRRRFLRAAALLTAGSLAGCPGLGSSDTATPDDAGSSPESTATDEPTPTTATRSETSTDTPTPTTTDEQTPTATPELGLGGAVTPRPDAAWPLPDRSVANDAYAADGPTFSSAPAVDWRVGATRPDETGEYDPELESPVVADGRVYAANALAFGPQQPYPHRQLLRAFDAASGEELWVHTVVDEEQGLPRPVGPVAGEDLVFFATHDTLRALDPPTGEAVWTRTLPGDVDSVTPGRERTYVAVSGTVHALDGRGETAWTTTVGEYVGARPALGPDHLYLGASNRLSALDPATGDVVWTATATLPGRDDTGSIGDVLAFANGVVVRRATGGLYAFDDGGEQVWGADREYTGAVTDGSRLYCGTDPGTVHAVDVSSGELRWDAEYGEELNSTVHCRAVAGDVLYVLVDDRPFAVGTADGTALWHGDVTQTDLVFGSDTLYGIGPGGDGDGNALFALR